MKAAEFNNQAIIVTGSSQGLGAAIAFAFAASGARVVVHYRSDQSGAESVVAKILEDNGEAISLQANLDNEDEVQSLFGAAESAFGPVAVLINNAGTFPNSPLLDMSPKQWRQMYADNVESTFLCTKAAGLSMRKTGGGAIVNIASISALNPGRDHSHYNSAKAAVIMFTQSAAQELGAFGIRVNAVAPGLVDRPGLDEQWPDGVKRYVDAAPLSCVVRPADVANACVFLASDKAARISGVVLPVDSGVMSASIY